MKPQLVSRTTCEPSVLAASVSAGMGAVLPSRCGRCSLQGTPEQQPYQSTMKICSPPLLTADKKCQDIYSVRHLVDQGQSIPTRTLSTGRDDQICDSKDITISMEQTKTGMIIITFPNIYINHSRIIVFPFPSSHDITHPSRPARGFALYSPKKTIDSFFVNNL